MNQLIDINDKYTKKLNNLITRKWCIGRRFRWYGASTFKTRTDECVKRNISVIPYKIIEKIIKNIKIKNETTIDYQKALEKTKILFGINYEPGAYRKTSRNKSTYRETSWTTSRIRDIEQIIEKLHSIDFFLSNFSIDKYIFSDIFNVEKTVNIVLLYNFLNILTTSNDYFEKKGLNIFRTHFGGSRKTRKLTNK